MASLQELKETRLRKLEALKTAGIDPYPAKVPRNFDLAAARGNFSDYEEAKGGKHAGKRISLAGRVVAIRGQGAILFAVLDDGTGTLQAVFKKDALDDGAFRLFADTADVGDIVSVTGPLFKTQRGEESILVVSWRMAAKSLLPLPEKWHGLVDPDERLRKRYLDFIMSPEERELFRKKAKFWDVTRAFMKARGFLEVETPTLEVTTGGAEARPFRTRHNDFDMDVFLRISVGELWQKRLMAAGFPKTFEIGRVYRNEGTSPEHAQEFTNMEFYWAYADYEDGMKLVAEMYRTVAQEVFGTTKFEYKGLSFDLAGEWKKIDYAEEIRRHTGIDINKAENEEMAMRLKKLKVPYEGANRERLTDTLWKHCRKSIAGPVFLVNHPALVAPLAKLVRTPAGPGTAADAVAKAGAAGNNTAVQMFQPIIAGSEVGRGYSELNDPIDQAGRFDEQEKMLKAGDEEAMMPDREFVEMLEHGMPPAFGWGHGERLFAILANKPLREVQFFPLMRPKK